MNLLTGISGAIKTAWDTIKDCLDWLPTEVKAICLVGLAAAIIYAVLGR